MCVPYCPAYQCGSRMLCGTARCCSTYAPGKEPRRLPAGTKGQGAAVGMAGSAVL
jgi:hypothetical protein